MGCAREGTEPEGSGFKERSDPDFTAEVLARAVGQPRQFGCEQVLSGYIDLRTRPSGAAPRLHLLPSPETRTRITSQAALRAPWLRPGTGDYSFHSW
jgi:hypothetical protein